MSDEVRVTIIADSTQVQNEMSDMERAVNKLGSLWQRVKQKVKAEIRGVIGSMQAFTNLFVNVLNNLGVALDPVGTAIVAAIQTTLASVLAMHRVLEAGSFGVMAGATIAMSAIAIGMAGTAIAAAAVGMNDMRRSMDQSITTAQSALTLVTSFSWI